MKLKNLLVLFLVVGFHELLGSSDSAEAAYHETVRIFDRACQQPGVAVVEKLDDRYGKSLERRLDNVMMYTAPFESDHF